ncbi:MAG: type II toxin-antitoxin system YhaV family toxin [Cyanobacteriota bacterium]
MAERSFCRDPPFGANHRHWSPAKFFQQFRLFFRFQARSRMIVLG